MNKFPNVRREIKTELDVKINIRMKAKYFFCEGFINQLLKFVQTAICKKSIYWYKYKKNYSLQNVLQQIDLTLIVYESSFYFSQYDLCIVKY